MENKNLLDQLTELVSELNDEQKEKAKECKNVDELMSYISECGIALPDDMFDNISGGIAIIYGQVNTNQIVPSQIVQFSELCQARRIGIDDGAMRIQAWNDVLSQQNVNPFTKSEKM